MPLSNDPRPVKQCVCHKTTFLQIRESGLKTIKEIAETFGCTTGCGLCKPYIEKVLHTGEVEFPIITES